MTSVLVIDDEPHVRAYARVVLTEEGYEVSEARNGAEALEWLDEHQPDVVVMDVHMPVMDGMTFVRELRERGYMLPLIVFTAHYPRSIAYQLNAAGYVSKSQPERLPETVTTVVRRATAEG